MRAGDSFVGWRQHKVRFAALADQYSPYWNGIVKKKNRKKLNLTAWKPFSTLYGSVNNVGEFFSGRNTWIILSAYIYKNPFQSCLI